MAGLTEIGLLPIEADKIISASLTLEERMQKKEFDNAPKDDVVRIGRLVSNSKITSRWLERWVAAYIGGKHNPKSDDGKDYGDIFANYGGLSLYRLGRDNIELKACEKDFRYSIGGGQHRFYENIPFYLYFQFQQGGENDSFLLYLLSKEEVHDEIFKYKVCRCTVSQGSGKTKKNSNGVVEKMTDSEVESLVQDSFDGKNDILWGFGIDSNPKEFKRKEPLFPKKSSVVAIEKYLEKSKRYLEAKKTHQKKVDTLYRWNTKYKVSLAELKDWENLLRTRYGI